MPEQAIPSPRGLQFGRASQRGEQQSVTLASAAALGIAGGDFTFEAWIRPQGVRSVVDLPLLATAPAAAAGGAAGVGLQLLVRSGRLFCALGDGTVAGNTPLAGDAWQHVALRYRAATREAALLVNGIGDAQGLVGPWQSEGILLLGRAGSAHFQGVMTEVRLWQEARSDEQIQAALYQRLSGLERNLGGLWPLNEGTGLVARDVRAPVNDSYGQPLPITPHDGRIAADSWAPLDDLPLRTLAPGVEAAAVVVAELRGLEGGLEAPNVPLAPGGSFTVEAWAQPFPTARDPESYPLVSLFGGGKGWELRCGGGQATLVVTVDGAARELTSRNLAAEAWLHVAGVYDGQFAYLYVNGVRTGILALGGAMTPYPGPLGIGCNTYWQDRGFGGRLAEVRVWNRALSQAEIQGWLFQRRAGDEDGLVGLWSLEGDGAAANEAFNATPRSGLNWMRGGAPLPDSAEGAQGASPAPAGLRIQLHAARARNARLAQQNRELAETARTQAEETARQVAQLAGERDQLLARLADLNEQVRRLTRANNDIAQDNQRLTEAKEELAKGSGARTTLQNFVQNANDSIKRAREELRRQGSAYNLERVALEVKMLPGPAGEGMYFPQMEEITGTPAGRAIDPNHLSVLSLEFTAGEPQEKPQIPESNVPSVIGYTELMARRKLADAGYQVTRDYQAVVQKPGEIVLADRVVDQLPRQGERWPLGGAVTIFIGREATVGS